MSVAAMLNRTCTVTRPTNAVSAGTHSDSYSAHLSAVPLRIHRMSGSEVVKYGGERNQQLWRMSFASGTDIARRDRITYSDVDGVSHTIDVSESYDSGESGKIRVAIGEEVS